MAHRYIKSLESNKVIKKKTYKHRGLLEINKIEYVKPIKIKGFGKIAAGGPIEAVPDKDILELDHIFSNEKCYALKVQGDSMIEAGINNGDWVIVEKQNKILKSKIAVILIDNQTIGWSGTPKQMLKSKNSKIQEFIKSTNPKLFK